MADERRLYERIDIEIPCRMFIPGEGKKASELRFEAFARSANLSLGGLFLPTTFLLPPDLELWLELKLPRGTLNVRGRVARAVAFEDQEGPSGLGLQFLGFDGKAREELLRFFTPSRYVRFFDDAARDFPAIGKELTRDQVSLLLNLWEEWKIAAKVPMSEAPLPVTVAPPKKASRGR